MSPAATPPAAAAAYCRRRRRPGPCSPSLLFERLPHTLHWPEGSACAASRHSCLPCPTVAASRCGLTGAAVLTGARIAAANALRALPAACCLLPLAPLQLMQADTFDLHSFHTLTGTTFMLLAEPHTPDAAELLRTT